MQTLQDCPTVRHWLAAQGVERVLVVSPHLDDAVLSLGELLRCLSSSAQVLTVFTDADPQAGHDWAQRGGFRDSEQEHAARRLEDIRALQHLGCSYRHAGLRSGQLDDTVLQERLPEWLGSEAGGHSGLLVLLPAGCGGEQPLGVLERFRNRLLRRPFGTMAHPEHVQVRDLFWRALAPHAMCLGFYAELPYAWRQSDPGIGAELRRLTGQPLVLSTIRPDVDKKCAAVEFYTSQVGLILGNSQPYRRRVLGRAEALFLVGSPVEGPP